MLLKYYFHDEKTGSLSHLDCLHFNMESHLIVCILRKESCSERCKGKTTKYPLSGGYAINKINLLIVVHCYKMLHIDSC